MRTSENPQKAKFGLAPSQTDQDSRRGSRATRGYYVSYVHFGNLYIRSILQLRSGAKRRPRQGGVHKASAAKDSIKAGAPKDPGPKLLHLPKTVVRLGTPRPLQ
jgi:hypothetical protein